MKAFNAYLFKLAESADLQATPLPPNATLREARHVHFTFSTSFWNDVDLKKLTQLVVHFPPFTVRPDATFGADRIEAPSTVTKFVESLKPQCLHMLKRDVGYFIKDANRSGLLTSKHALYISYWPHELCYTRTTTWVQKALSIEKRFCFPRAKNMVADILVYKWIEKSCRTMGELGEYRGLMWASRANKQKFESVWKLY
jgi:hypothetical protein